MTRRVMSEVLELNVIGLEQVRAEVVDPTHLARLLSRASQATRRLP